MTLESIQTSTGATTAAAALCGDEGAWPPDWRADDDLRRERVALWADRGHALHLLRQLS